jgi:hypothetical protein
MRLTERNDILDILEELTIGLQICTVLELRISKSKAVDIADNATSSSSPHIRSHQP